MTLRGRAVQPVPERGFGVLITGGVDGAGTAEASSWLYDPLTHKLVAAGKPMTLRRGAALSFAPPQLPQERAALAAADGIELSQAAETGPVPLHPGARKAIEELGGS